MSVITELISALENLDHAGDPFLVDLKRVLYTARDATPAAPAPEQTSPQDTPMRGSYPYPQT